MPEVYYKYAFVRARPAAFSAVFWSAINVNSAIDLAFSSRPGVLVISINVTDWPRCRHFTNNTKLQSLLVALPTPCGAIFEGVPLRAHAGFFFLRPIILEFKGISSSLNKENFDAPLSQMVPCISRGFI